MFCCFFPWMKSVPFSQNNFVPTPSFADLLHCLFHTLDCICQFHRQSSCQYGKWRNGYVQKIPSCDLIHISVWQAVLRLSGSNITDQIHQFDRLFYAFQVPIQRIKFIRKCEDYDLRKYWFCSWASLDLPFRWFLPSLNTIIFCPSRPSPFSCKVFITTFGVPLTVSWKFLSRS